MATMDDEIVECEQCGEATATSESNVCDWCEMILCDTCNLSHDCQEPEAA